MDDPSLDLAAVLALLNAPFDGRLLAFGATTADPALAIAAERPDLLIIVCDTTSEVTRAVSDHAVSNRLDNIVVGDTHAGPPVDRALSVGAMSTMAPAEFLAVRSAMLPGGYAVFIEPGTSATAAIEQLKGLGYAVADELKSPFPDRFVVRAR